MHCGIVDDTHTDPQPLPPWQRIPAIRDAAIKLQMLQIKQAVLMNDLHAASLHQSLPDRETARSLIHTENAMKLNRLEMQLVQGKLHELLGELTATEAILIEAGDQRLCLCNENGELWVRSLVGLDDYIEQVGGQQQ